MRAVWPVYSEVVNQLNDMHPLALDVLNRVIHADFMSFRALRLLDLECYIFGSSLDLSQQMSCVLPTKEKDALSIVSKPCGRIISVAQFAQNKVSSIEKRVLQVERMISS